MQINDKAVLVRLSIGMPGNTRKDKSITDEVKLKHALGDKSGRWLKQLYPSEAFEPLTKLAGEARIWNYAHTLPWTDDGSRILPTAHHFDYTAKLREFRQAFETLAESHFIGRLNEWIEQARVTHNGTFDPSQYLSIDALRSKFSFTTDFSPVPSSADFRVTLSADEMSAMANDLDARVASAVEVALADLWSRLAAPVQHLADKLKDSDAHFRDSLVGNIREIVDLIPALNLTSDPQLDLFKKEVEASLAGLDPQTLRDDSKVRADAAAKAQDILSRMQGYQGYLA